MRLDLSSQIVLDNVPVHYYCPANEFELSALTRYEKVKTEILEEPKEASLRIAAVLAKQIKEKDAKGENFVLGLPGGNSPLFIYEELLRMHKAGELSFKNVIVFFCLRVLSIGREST